MGEKIFLKLLATISSACTVSASSRVLFPFVLVTKFYVNGLPLIYVRPNFILMPLQIKIKLGNVIIWVELVNSEALCLSLGFPRKAPVSIIKACLGPTHSVSTCSLFTLYLQLSAVNSTITWDFVIHTEKLLHPLQRTAPRVLLG